MNVIHLEKPKSIVVSLGGQTAINLANRLHKLGVPIIGTGVAPEKKRWYVKAPVFSLSLIHISAAARVKCPFQRPGP